jgi:hypothetical protein
MLQSKRKSRFMELLNTEYKLAVYPFRMSQTLKENKYMYIFCKPEIVTLLKSVAIT